MARQGAEEIERSVELAVTSSNFQLNVRVANHAHLRGKPVSKLFDCLVTFVYLNYSFIPSALALLCASLYFMGTIRSVDIKGKGQQYVSSSIYLTE